MIVMAGFSGDFVKVSAPDYGFLLIFAIRQATAVLVAAGFVS